METSSTLEITSVLDQYDGPLSGEARLGETRLYYYCIDQRKDHRRIFCAWELSEDEWALVERDLILEDAAVSVDGGDGPPEAMEAAMICCGQIGDMHHSLLGRECVLGFVDGWLPFPKCE